jgi:hypothetical protein
MEGKGYRASASVIRLFYPYNDNLSPSNGNENSLSFPVRQPYRFITERTTQPYRTSSLELDITREDQKRQWTKFGDEQKNPVDSNDSHFFLPRQASFPRGIVCPSAPPKSDQGIQGNTPQKMIDWINGGIIRISGKSTALSAKHGQT